MDQGIVHVFMENTALIWLGLFIILIVIELFTVGLTTIWFAGGALTAMIAGIFGADILAQILIFLAVSCVLLIFTRPWAMKHLNQKRVRTNYESEIGYVRSNLSALAERTWTIRRLCETEEFGAKLEEVLPVAERLTGLK